MLYIFNRLIDVDGKTARSRQQKKSFCNFLIFGKQDSQTAKTFLALFFQLPFGLIMLDIPMNF